MVKKKHRTGNYLRDWEIALVKSMLKTETYTKQEIQSYFSRPSRSINQARFVEIENEEFPDINEATPDELSTYLKKWTLVKIPTPDTYSNIIEDDDIWGHLRAIFRAIKAKLFKKKAD